MKSLLIQTGSQYQLHIGGPTIGSGEKITIGIKNDRNFDPRTNYIAIFLDEGGIKQVIDDLKSRLKEITKEI